MNVIATGFPEVLIIEPKVFGDRRSFFVETFHADRYAQHGIAAPFVQDDLSRSAGGRVARTATLLKPRDEIAVRWNDPAIGIAWGVDAPELSARDAAAPLLADVPTLPIYGFV